MKSQEQAGADSAVGERCGVFRRHRIRRDHLQGGRRHDAALRTGSQTAVAQRNTAHSAARGEGSLAHSLIHSFTHSFTHTFILYGIIHVLHYSQRELYTVSTSTPQR